MVGGARPDDHRGDGVHRAAEGIGEILGTLGARTGIDRGQLEGYFFFFDRMRTSSLIRRFASPDEVAKLTVYLPCPLASTNGTALRAEGGIMRSVT